MTAGESATFECELSYEGISVDWFLGGKKMEASERVRNEKHEKMKPVDLLLAVSPTGDGVALVPSCAWLS